MENKRIPTPGKIASIVLAADMGTRMGKMAGTPKQLLPLGGRPVLERVIQNGLASRILKKCPGVDDCLVACLLDTKNPVQ